MARKHCGRKERQIEPGIVRLDTDCCDGGPVDHHAIEIGMEANERSLPGKNEKIEHSGGWLASGELCRTAYAVHENVVLGAWPLLPEQNLEGPIEANQPFGHRNRADGDQAVPKWVEAARLDVHDDEAPGADSAAPVKPRQGTIGVQCRALFGAQFVRSPREAREPFHSW